MPIHIVGDDGTELPAGEKGAVVFFDGDRTSSTTATREDARAATTAGWRTLGDVGRLDEDGYLYLTDRGVHDHQRAASTSTRGRSRTCS